MSSLSCSHLDECESISHVSPNSCLVSIIMPCETTSLASLGLRNKHDRGKGGKNLLKLFQFLNKALVLHVVIINLSQLSLP